MRPLILPDPLPAQPDIFITPDDDFLVLIAGDQSSASALQSSLESLVNSATDPANDIGGDLDAIGACWDGVDATFGKLNDSISDVDLTATIAQVAAIEDVFASGILGWALDLTGVANLFLSDLYPVFEYWLIPTNLLIGGVRGIAESAYEDAEEALALYYSSQPDHFGS